MEIFSKLETMLEENEPLMTVIRKIILDFTRQDRMKELQIYELVIKYGL